MKTVCFNALAIALTSSLMLTACNKPADNAATTTASAPVTATAASASTASTPTAVPVAASAASSTVTTTTTTTTTTSASTTSATSTNLSPTMAYWVAGNRGGIGQMLGQKFPNMTAEQKACLKSSDGDATYTKELQPILDKTFTPEELAQADAYFGSAEGKKLVAMMQAQLEGTTPPQMTAEEQKAIMEAMKKPFMIKMQQQTASQDPKAMMAMMMKIADSEQARCKIS